MAPGAASVPSSLGTVTERFGSWPAPSDADTQSQGSVTSQSDRGSTSPDYDASAPYSDRGSAGCDYKGPIQGRKKQTKCYPGSRSEVSPKIPVAPDKVRYRPDNVRSR